MRTLMTAWMIALFLVILAVASGCEDSPVTAGEGDQIYLVALPPTVHVDPDNATAPMTSTIVATIVNATGVPKKDVLVFFGSDGGELASGSQPVSTDSNGNAYDVLTIQPSGPGDIPVVATSTSLTQTVTVTNGACDDNPAPTASFPAVTNPPPGLQGETKTVTLTGTATDVKPGGAAGTITSYAWDCGNQTTGGTEAGGSCSYVVGASTTSYTIRFTVKDNGLGEAQAPYACQKSGTDTNQVTISVQAVP